MSDFVLYVTAATVGNPMFENTPARFSVDYRKLPLLKGEWECALLQYSLDCQFTPKRDRLYLCADFLLESDVNLGSERILAPLEIRGKYKKYIRETVSHPVYIPVKNKSHCIEFKILDEDLQTVQFTSNDIHLQLHFRKRLFP